MSDTGTPSPTPKPAVTATDAVSIGADAAKVASQGWAGVAQVLATKEGRERYKPLIASAVVAVVLVISLLVGAFIVVVAAVAGGLNTDASCATPTAVSTPSTFTDTDLSTLMFVLTMQESRRNWTATSTSSSAAGAAQILRPTWRSGAALVPGAASYDTANLAPQAVQEQVILALFKSYSSLTAGDITLLPVVWFIGRVPPDFAADWNIVGGSIGTSAGNGDVTPAVYRATTVVDLAVAAAFPQLLDESSPAIIAANKATWEAVFTAFAAARRAPGGYDTIIAPGHGTQAATLWTGWRDVVAARLLVSPASAGTGVTVSPSSCGSAGFVAVGVPFPALVAERCDGLSSAHDSITVSQADKTIFKATKAGFTLDYRVVDSFNAMYDAALAAGITLSGAGLRTIDEYDGSGAIRNGNHQRGLAVDLNESGTAAVISLFTSPTRLWLDANAWKYGWGSPRFIRPISEGGSGTGGFTVGSTTAGTLEPWHWEPCGGQAWLSAPPATTKLLAAVPGDGSGPTGIPD